MNGLPMIASPESRIASSIIIRMSELSSITSERSISEQQSIWSTLWRQIVDGVLRTKLVQKLFKFWRPKPVRQNLGSDLQHELAHHRLI